MKRRIKGGKNLNNETVTIEDCLDNHEKKGKAVVINDGQVIGFVKEN